MRLPTNLLRFIYFVLLIILFGLISPQIRAGTIPAPSGYYHSLIVFGNTQPVFLLKDYVPALEGAQMDLLSVEDYPLPTPFPFTLISLDTRNSVTIYRIPETTHVGLFWYEDGTWAYYTLDNSAVNEIMQAIALSLKLVPQS